MTATVAGPVCPVCGKPALVAVRVPAPLDDRATAGVRYYHAGEGVPCWRPNDREDEL